MSEIQVILTKGGVAKYQTFFNRFTCLSIISRNINNYTSIDN